MKNNKVIFIIIGCVLLLYIAASLITHHFYISNSINDSSSYGSYLSGTLGIFIGVLNILITSYLTYLIYGVSSSQLNTQVLLANVTLQQNAIQAFSSETNIAWAAFNKGEYKEIINYNIFLNGFEQTDLHLFPKTRTSVAFTEYRNLINQIDFYSNGSDKNSFVAIIVSTGWEPTFRQLMQTVLSELRTDLHSNLIKA